MDLLTLPHPATPLRVAGRPHRPALAAAAALGVCLVVNVVDPNEQGSLGTCPFKLVTGGLDCPGCGTLRATRALTRGDVGLALDHNVLFVLMAPVLLWGLAAWWRAERGVRAAKPALPAWAGVALAVAVPVWWLARNLPWFTWLASGAS